MNGGYEWDETKNKANRRKHGISFEEASTIFSGVVLTVEDDSGDTEVRERSYGLLGGIILVCAVHTDRNGSTRIISARKATSHEQALFNAHLRRTHGRDRGHPR